MEGIAVDCGTTEPLFRSIARTCHAQGAFLGKRKSQLVFFSSFIVCVMERRLKASTLWTGNSGLTGIPAHRALLLLLLGRLDGIDNV